MPQYVDKNRLVLVGACESEYFTQAHGLPRPCGKPTTRAASSGAVPRSKAAHSPGMAIQPSQNYFQRLGHVHHPARGQHEQGSSSALHSAATEPVRRRRSFPPARAAPRTCLPWPLRPAARSSCRAFRYYVAVPPLGGIWRLITNWFCVAKSRACLPGTCRRFQSLSKRGHPSSRRMNSTDGAVHTGRFRSCRSLWT